MSGATRGRPTVYTPEIAEEILGRLSEGEPLKTICRDAHMPAGSTVRLWALQDREGFFAPYARARELCAHTWVDEIIEISDDGTNDWMKRQKGDAEPEWSLNGEHVQRSRLRVDSRKFLAAQILPTVYGKSKPEDGGESGANDIVISGGLPDDH